MPVTPDEVKAPSPLDEMEAAFEKNAITAEEHIRKGKAFLRERKAERFKLRKGAPDVGPTFAKGVKIIAETDLEIECEVRVPDSPVRQRQWIEFAKMMGLYPADRIKLDVSGSLGVDVTQHTPEEQAAYIKGARVVEEELARASIEKRRRERSLTAEPTPF